MYAVNNFVKIGDTSIDLNGYVTTTALNTALTNYTNTARLETLLADKVDTDDYLSDNDWAVIMSPLSLGFRFFTEDFSEYAPDAYAQEYGYNDWAILADFIKNFSGVEYTLLPTGSQMFVDTGEIMTYDGEDYRIFKMYTGNPQVSAWYKVKGYYGLVRADMTLSTLQSHIPTNAEDIINNPFTPIEAIIDRDSNIYKTDPGAKYCLIYAEEYNESN